MKLRRESLAALLECDINQQRTKGVLMVERVKTCKVTTSNFIAVGLITGACMKKMTGKAADEGICFVELQRTQLALRHKAAAQSTSTRSLLMKNYLQLPR